MKIEITNLDEFKEQVKNLLLKSMDSLGQLTANEIQNKIKEYNLFIGGDYWRGIYSKMDGEELIIDSNVDYAVYLEYGTYAFWKQYGTDSFPDVPIKKKNLPYKIRSKMAKGMQPFAPFRRVLWNKKLMERNLQKSIDYQIKRV